MGFAVFQMVSNKGYNKFLTFKDKTYKYISLSSGISVLSIIFLLLLIGSFARSVNDSNQLTFYGLLNYFKDLDRIPTGWIKTLSNWVRSDMINSLDGGFSLKAILGGLRILLYPLPFICYMVVGILNVIWIVFNFILIIFGGSYFI